MNESTSAFIIFFLVHNNKEITRGSDVLISLATSFHLLKEYG